jgi:Family of unknown function (DUF6220)
MEGVRRGARAVLKYFAPLMVVLIVVQILLAGEGIFGIKKGPKLDDQKTLDPHRFLGFLITEPIALLFLIAALLAWLPNKRLRWVTIILPIWTFVQALLAEGGRWVGMFHPLNAFVLLGLYGWLSGQFHRRGGALSDEHVATPAPTA